MKKSSIFLKRATVLALMIGGVFSSCKKDDTPVEPPVEVKLPSVEVSNVQLKAALVLKGFPFDEQGYLVKTDSVLDITAIDLSNCELSDASGLDVFPKLEEVNLAGNKFFYSFDFSVLPASVTRANLTGNEIYEFPGLLTVVIEENDDETVTLLRPLTKLHLPYSARYNCSELVYLYEQLKSKIDSGDAEIKIENENNQITAYNTLREVPNDITRARLQSLYPSFFEGDYIDIGKRVFDPTEVKKTMAINSSTIATVDGAQYILHHRDFRGATVALMVMSGDVHTVIPYLKVPSHLNQLQLEHVDTPNGIDCSKAENIYRIFVYNNRGLKTLDLNASKLCGQRDVAVEYSAATSSTINFEACADLEEIVFPEAATGFHSIQLYDLPALKTLDLVRFEAIWKINLVLLPNTSIVYPELKKWIYSGTFDDDRGSTALNVRRDIAHQTATKNFIKTYRTHLTSGAARPLSSRITYDRYSEEESYAWSNDKDLLDNL